MLSGPVIVTKKREILQIVLFYVPSILKRDILTAQDRLFVFGPMRYRQFYIHKYLMYVFYHSHLIIFYENQNDSH